MIEARVTGATHDEIGGSLGKSARTVARRLALPGVAAEVTRRQLDAFGATRSKLVTNSERAARVLSDLLESEDEAVQLRAAVQLLTLAGRLHHQTLVEHELVERVEALEGDHAQFATISEQEARYAQSKEILE
jgi:CII-binding regulator of phage lambda lysogenization HflD